MHKFNRVNAPFHWQKVTGNFKAVVKVSGGLKETYSKAGLMVKLDDENFVFTGMEHFNNRVNHSTSHTVGHTDWSLAALPPGSEDTGVWFCYNRMGGTYECYYSFDGVKWILTRMGKFTERPVLYVGICCASPSAKGFRVTFDYYACKS